MDEFGYVRARDVEGAVRLMGEPGGEFIAGGTNLLDLMKGGVATPTRLVDISRLAGMAQIHELPGGGVRVGALAANSDTAAHPLIRSRYPLLSKALLAGASPQLRNMATVGGNLMQRTRCPYFYDVGFEACNKRRPGSGCAAVQGYNRNHAILGADERCIATNPSDMNVALVALDATLNLRSGRGSRQLPVRAFHRLPGDTPNIDTVLAPGEIITSVDLAADGFAAHCHYLKVRDRASYAFALVSVAAAVDLDGDTVRGVTLALGGVAHKPWYVAEAPALMAGKPWSAGLLESVAAAAVQGAKSYGYNDFKIELAKRSMVRALAVAAGRREV